MIDSNFLLALPKPFKDICEIYPPKVNDVVGSKDFNIYQTMLTISQEELDKDFHKDLVNGTVDRVPNPFEYFMANCAFNEKFKEQAINSFLFFIHEPVTIIPEIRVVIIGKEENDLDPDVDLENPRIINEGNFNLFQNAIRESLGESAVEEEENNIDEDPRVARIKALSRYRDKVKAEKERREGKQLSLGTILASICCMDMGLNPLNIGEISYASVQWLVEMYQQKESYETGLRSIVAGADPKKVKLKYWIRNLDNLDD